MTPWASPLHCEGELASNSHVHSRRGKWLPGTFCFHLSSQKCGWPPMGIQIENTCISNEQWKKNTTNWFLKVTVVIIEKDRNNERVLCFSIPTMKLTSHVMWSKLLHISASCLFHLSNGWGQGKWIKWSLSVFPDLEYWTSKCYPILDLVVMLK